MAGPLSKALPPPPSAAVRAQRRKQKRLVWGAVAGFLCVGGAWQVYEYVASSAQRAEAEVQEGMKLLTPSHYQEAIAQFTRALQTDPGSWNAYVQRGFAKENLGALDEALTDYQAALILKPDLVEARTARANVYRALGDRKHAIEELTKVIESKPTAEAHSIRGAVYAELGQHELAILDFDWVIEQLRDAPLAYYARAKSKRALGDLAGATRDEETGLSFDSGLH